MNPIIYSLYFPSHNQLWTSSFFWHWISLSLLSLSLFLWELFSFCIVVLGSLSLIAWWFLLTYLFMSVLLPWFWECYPRFYIGTKLYGWSFVSIRNASSFTHLASWVFRLLVFLATVYFLVLSITFFFYLWHNDIDFHTQKLSRLHATQRSHLKRK